MRFSGNMVGTEKSKSGKLVVVEELTVEGKKNLFTIFPIGATMQDGGKRKRSGETSLSRRVIFNCTNLIDDVTPWVYN